MQIEITKFGYINIKFGINIYQKLNSFIDWPILHRLYLGHIKSF